MEKILHLSSSQNIAMKCHYCVLSTPVDATGHIPERAHPVTSNAAIILITWHC